MAYLLVIGEITPAQYEPCRRKSARIKHITVHEALQGHNWHDNEAADQLRKLLGCEPTEVVTVVMPEEVWQNPDSILRAQYDYFTSCDGSMWVVRPDGEIEFV